MLHHLSPNQQSSSNFLLLLVLRCRRLSLGCPPYRLGSVLALLACQIPRSQHINPTIRKITNPDRTAPSLHVEEKLTLTLLPTGLLDLCSRPVPHQPIMRLELLHHLMAVVYQGESRRLAPTVLCAETEAGDLVLVGFVEFGELLAEFVF